MATERNACLGYEGHRQSVLPTHSKYRQFLIVTFTTALVNVFKVKHGKETHVYRTDSALDKKNMLAQFRHIAEELSAKRRKEREGEHERRKSLWAGGGVRPRGSLFLIL